MADEATVAYHEAAHVVIAHHVGAAIIELSLDAQQNGDGSIEWDGNVRMDVSGLYAPAIVQIAVAGPLVEGKFEVARQACPDQKSQSLDDFLRKSHIDEGSAEAFVNALLAVYESQDPEKMKAELHLIIDSYKYPGSVLLGDSLQDARDLFTASGIDRTNAIPEIRTVIHLLNSAKIWASIVALATELQSVTVSSHHTKVLDACKIANILNCSR